MRHARAVSVLALALAACSPRPVPADPALWEVSCLGGGKGWLFGTIHSLEQPADWRDSAIDAALDEANMVVVEIADLDDAAKGGQTFARLATSPAQGLLSSRVEPALRPALLKVLKKHHLSDDQFAKIETWAAALTIARAATTSLDSEYGIDRAVIEAAGDRRVVGLEGFERQLAIFDTLPEKEQRDLLEAIVTDAGALDGQSPDLAAAWLKGDMGTIEAETRRGLLADPELREALFTDRNRAWTQSILAGMKDGNRPFVAVGAAHMAGPDGLPALLEKSGCTVRRVQ